MCQETLRHLAGWFHLLFWTNSSTPLELLTQKSIVILIMWSIYSFRFLEQSVTISNLIPVRKVPYQNFYLKQHIMHPVLQMWMPSNLDRYNMIHSTVAKFIRIVRSALWSNQKLSINAQYHIVFLIIIIPQGFLYLKSYFHLCQKNILSAMHVDWDPVHLSLVVCYILHLLVSLPYRNW